MSNFLSSASASSGSSGRGSASPAWSQSGSIRAPGQVSVCQELKDMGDLAVGPLTVIIAEIPLQGPLGFFARLKGQDGHGLIGKHDYLRVNFGIPDKWIMAEKVGESGPGRSAGIHITLETDQPGQGDQTMKRHSVHINGPGHGVRWTMAQLLKVMSTNYNANYHLLEGNCWQYAYSCAEAILMWCIEHAGGDRDLRAKLQQDLEDLKHVERPMPMDVIRYAVNPNAAESRKTGELLQRKLTHTNENVPSTSVIRRPLLGIALKVITHRNKKHAGIDDHH